jgi:hypothetical protein
MCRVLAIKTAKLLVHIQADVERVRKRSCTAHFISRDYKHTKMMNVTSLHNVTLREPIGCYGYVKYIEYGCNVYNFSFPVVPVSTDDVMLYKHKATGIEALTFSRANNTSKQESGTNRRSATNLFIARWQRK